MPYRLIVLWQFKSQHSQLLVLKTPPRSQAADEDGSGELDIGEFCAKLGPHLGVNLKPQQAAQLFMKIDADAGGTVDW